MNVVAHLFLCGGILLGVILGDPRAGVFNRYDDNAVSLVILGFVLAVLDTLLTIYDWIN